MTTEQCSVDSLLPKSRTETFARQLQSRLRTLSAESERDGLEDSSWNGDQLSSSSDNDIYYDLDSSPGSPAEEATESDYPGYINIKNSDSIYPSSSSNNFLNSNEHSSNTNTNDKVDCRFLGQIYRSNNLNNCQSVNLANTCFRLNESEKDYVSCDQCSTSQNPDNISLPQIINSNTDGENKSSSSFLLNGFTDSSQSLNKQLNLMNKNEPLNQINGFIHVSPITVHENGQLKNNFDPSANDIWPDKKENNQEICNGLSNDEKSHNEILNNCYTCEKFDNGESVDVNCNSSNNNSNFYTCNSDSANQILEKNLQTSVSSSVNEEQHEISKSLDDCNVSEEYKDMNYGSVRDNCSNNRKSDPVQYTEDDLCRLVDAVFLKSQDEEYNDLINTENNSKNNAIDKNDNRHDDDDDDDGEEIESIESKRSKFRRCSSLKTGKTPPGTPGRKKIVRFADVLGLDLADVRTFLDEVPKVPKSAYVDLKNVELSSSPVILSPLDYFGQSGLQSQNNKVDKLIVPFFQQPSSRADFLDRIKDDFVCLENAIISDSVLSVITGIVRVKNIDFHKSVHIRYSIDNWKSFADLQAKYVPNSCDGFSDKFSFMLYAHMLNMGQRLEFAIRYHAKGSLFWDNNFGANYVFQCTPNGPSKVSISYAPPNPTEKWATFY